MKIIGLTGSIAMGKSYVAKIFKKLSIQIFDSDKAVGEIILENKELIAKYFPESYIDGAINKSILSQIIFNSLQRRKILESIIHPRVAHKRSIFIKKARYQRSNIVICEQILLFEKNHQKNFDDVITVSAPKFLQTKRCLRRTNMDLDKFRSILKSQMPDYKKRSKSDHVIFTGGNRASVMRQILKILSELTVE